MLNIYVVVVKPQAEVSQSSQASTTSKKQAPAPLQKTNSSRGGTAKAAVVAASKQSTLSRQDSGAKKSMSKAPVVGVGSKKK